MGSDLYEEYLIRIKDLFVRVTPQEEFEVLLQIAIAEAKNHLSEREYQSLLQWVYKYIGISKGASVEVLDGYPTAPVAALPIATLVSYATPPVIVPGMVASGLAVSAAADRLTAAAERAWDLALASALVYVLMKMRRNPGAMTHEMESGETKMLLSAAAGRAELKVEPILEKAVRNGSLLGYQRAKDARSYLKAGRPDPIEFSAGGISKFLRADLKKISEDAYSAIAKAAKTEDEDEVRRAFKRLSLRVRMVIEAAVKMHATLTLIQHAAGLDVRIMWRSSRAEPCKHCRKLHGEIVNVGEAFDAGDFPVYGKVLFGPSLHPSCRCFLVLVTR